MSRVRRVLQDAVGSTQTAFLLDLLNAWEWSALDALNGFHHLFQSLALRDRAAAVLDCDTVSKYALDHAAVEIHQDG